MRFKPAFLTAPTIAVIACYLVLACCGSVAAQRKQFKIEPNGDVLKLKRVNVTTFVYVPHAKAELRTDASGKSIWSFTAPNGTVYTAPAPNRPDAPRRYTPAELAVAFEAAKKHGKIPTEVKVDSTARRTTFLVKFVKNTLEVRWHAQVGMSAEEYESLNRALRSQGFRPLFGEVYMDQARQTRFVAGWRR